MTQFWTCPHTPPSVNAMFPTSGKRRVKSGDYRIWIQAAGYSLNATHLRKYVFPVKLTITFGNLPKSSDISNRIKAVEDLLVSHGILAGDSVKHVHSVTACVSEEPFDGFQVKIDHSYLGRDHVCQAELEAA